MKKIAVLGHGVVGSGVLTVLEKNRSQVERALGVSYPTVKNMLDAALAALGLDQRPEERAQREKAEKAEVLSRLASGELDVEAAIQALNQLKGGA